MPAITLHQPWASLISLGYKTCETRSWRPPRDLVSKRIAIHAGATLPPLVPQAVEDVLSDRIGPLWRGALPRQAVVATAELWFAGHVVEHRAGIAVIENSLQVAHVPIDAYGDFSLGRWLWLLRDVKLLMPAHQTRGHQRVWSWAAPEGVE